MGYTNQDPGCCCGGACDITICVTACGAAQPGIPVQVESGSSVVASGTTGGGGCVTFTTLTAGTYTVVVSVPGFDVNTSSHSLVCGTSTTIDVGIFPDTGACCGSCALPETLFWTDANGTFPITNLFGGTFWQGCYTLSLPSIALIGEFPNCSCTDDTTVIVAIQLQCNGDTTYTATAYWMGVCCAGLDVTGVNCNGVFQYSSLDPEVGGVPTVCDGPQDECPITTVPTNPFLNSANLTATAISCVPFAWSGNLISAGSFIGPPGGIGAVTITS